MDEITEFVVFYRIPGRSVKFEVIAAHSKGDARKQFYTQYVSPVYDIVDILTVADALQRYTDILTRKFKGLK